MQAEVRNESRLDVMNFLNEISSDYPDAISFASGRPAETFFELECWLAQIPRFARHFSERRGKTLEEGFNLLAQYGPTGGIICDLIAQQLRVDEDMHCSPGQVVVTNGCQEAMELAVRHLCPQPDDVVLVRTPCYIGITGVADLSGIELFAFCADEPGQYMAALINAVEAAEKCGKRPRAVYLVPDFDNPTGTVLSRTMREEIITFCFSKRIVILEDNPYGMFRYEGEKEATMFALDDHGCVIYLGTYSKTICPALRIGFAAVPDALFGEAGSGSAFVQGLVQAKSFISVNTSNITQAVVGALLLTEECSLRRVIAPALERYRENRDAMVATLSSSFAGMADRVQWNIPAGGFFLTVKLPFRFGAHEAKVCAEKYGVLVMPLSFFALDDRHDYFVRLAFSNVTPALISSGIGRFERFVFDHLDPEHAG